METVIHEPMSMSIAPATFPNRKNTVLVIIVFIVIALVIFLAITLSKFYQSKKLLDKAKYTLETSPRLKRSQPKHASTFYPGILAKRRAEQRDTNTSWQKAPKSAKSSEDCLVPPEAPTNEEDYRFFEPHRLLQDPDSNLKRNFKEFIIHVDSASRDVERWPTTQEYFFPFPTLLRNVVAVDVLQAQFPQSQYVVDTCNQTLFISENGGLPIAITLPVGDYTVSELESAVTAELNVSVLMNTYAVTSVPSPPLLSKFVFTRTSGAATFQLLFSKQFNPNCCVSTLYGFDPEDTQPVVTTITAPHKHSLACVQYIDVVAAELEKCYPDDGILARIPLVPNTPCTSFNPPILPRRAFWPQGKMGGLTLRMFAGPTLKPTSVLYNFNGKQNSLTLRITTTEYRNIFIDSVCIEPTV